MKTTLTMALIAVLCAVVLGLAAPLLVLKGAGHLLAGTDVSPDMLWPFGLALIYCLGPLLAGVLATWLSIRVMRYQQASREVSRKRPWGSAVLVGLLSGAMSIALSLAWMWLPLWIH